MRRTLAGLFGLSAIAALGCPPRPAADVEGVAAAYAAELAACSQTSSTLEESIACENRARARHGRPLRAMPDAGSRDAS